MITNEDKIARAAARAEGRTEGCLRAIEEISRWFGVKSVPGELERRLKAVAERYIHEQAATLHEFTAELSTARAAAGGRR